MKKMVLSDTKLSQIIRLRESGKKWTEIQRETGVPRRIAQVRYNEARRSKSLEELKSAREKAAAEALNEHVKSLLEMAEFLAINLDTPRSPKEWRKADDFIQNLFELNISLKLDDTRMDKEEMNRRTRWELAEKKSLLDSLRKHTPGKRWEAFNQWSKAWDSCIDALEWLRVEANRIAGKILDKDHEVTNKIREAVSNKQQMAAWFGDAAITAIWDSIVKEQFDTVTRKVKVSTQLVDQAEPPEFAKAAKQGDEEIQSHVWRICKTVVKNLCDPQRTGLVDQLQSDIKIIRKALDDFIVSMNRHALLAEIFETKCELCPA